MRELMGQWADIAGTPASKPTTVMKSKGKTKAVANTMKQYDEING